MKVSTSDPFRIIFSVYKHEYLGYLFESFAVQLDEKGKPTLRNQNISSRNMNDFRAGIDKDDPALIGLIDEINQDAIIKKFSEKRIDPADFFLNVYDERKGDKNLQEAIKEYIEEKKAQIMEFFERGKPLYEMGHDGDPAHSPIVVMPHRASVLFQFMRNEENTHYFPTIIYDNMPLEFREKNAVILCDRPAWLLLEGKLYGFERKVDGNKIKPFLNKRFIVIPKNIEETYYIKFVAPVIENFDVYAKGFKINPERYRPVPVLNLYEYATSSTAVAGNYRDEDIDANVLEEDEVQVAFELKFRYGKFTFDVDPKKDVSVKMEKAADSYIFHKIRREPEFEQDIEGLFKNLNLDLESGRIILSRHEAFEWLNLHREHLESKGIEIVQDFGDKQYFLGESSLDLEITENNDWFDVKAVVKFGNYEIPFAKLRHLIIKKQREFVLPGGEIAVIPEAWFARYSEIFSFMSGETDKDLKLRKYHVALLKDLENQNLAKLHISRKLEKLRDFSSIDEYLLPVHFKGKLRSYQKAGYNWLRFLGEYNFGGCLADDMGLGKTVQTLALLQHRKELGIKTPSLLVVPTSLVYNWEMEAKKFTPKLKMFTYTGPFRDKNTEQFEGYDVILTSYGIIRIDEEMLSSFWFDYIILDESQAIKNPKSNIAKAVQNLRSNRRLILTGTPLENSILDLWSQMTFINPGLLGNKAFFNNEFIHPIEKKKDEEKTRKLHALVKPFILRRNKLQVAKDLPEKSENIKYCSMTPEQEKIYEQAKSSFRNTLLEIPDEKNVSSSQLLILQGLTKLRQLANHPAMTEENYSGASGKLEVVTHMLDEIAREGHKVLVFSQFVKHLTIIRNHLDAEGKTYAYLDGSTKDRAAEVERFQNDKSVNIFLISLKAGGVGLNLTAADYVFLLDPWWNPAVEAQAVDRAHRIGQKRNVMVYKFITKNTVEEKILRLQQHKQQLMTSLITKEDGFIKSLTREDLDLLLE